MRVRNGGLISCGIGVIALAGWIGLAARPRPAPTSPPTRPVRDMTGHEVNLPIRPSRVLSLCTSATDTLLRLKAGDRLAAMDEYSRIVPGTDHIPVAGKGSAISREQVIAMGIDLAFVWWFHDDAAATLEQLSVPCVRICEPRLEQVGEMIRFVGECMNCREPAEQLAASLPPVTTTSDGDSPTTVYLEMYGPFKTVGQDCYIDDLLRQAGLSNIVTDRKGGLLISAERLIQADPDVILFVREFASIQAVAARSGLRGLRAVTAGRVHPIDRYWFVAGAGWPRAVEEIRRTIHNPPEPMVATTR